MCFLSFTLIFFAVAHTYIGKKNVEPHMKFNTIAKWSMEVCKHCMSLDILTNMQFVHGVSRTSRDICIYIDFYL